SLVRRRAWRDGDEGAWTALAVWGLGGLVATALSPFRLAHYGFARPLSLAHYGLPSSFGIALLAARAWEADTGRRLGLVHAAVFAAVALGLALAWTGGGPRLYAAMVDTADA